MVRHRLLHLLTIDRAYVVLAARRQHLLISASPIKVHLGLDQRVTLTRKTTTEPS